MDRVAAPRAPAALLALVLAGCGFAGDRSAPDAAGRPGEQVAERFSHRIERTLETNSLLFLPSGYDREPDRAWPLILHLHGGGGRGDDPDRLRHYPLVQRVEREPDFPFIVATPQCPAGRPGPFGDTWTEHDDLVLAVLDHLLARYRIDEDRVYLVGHSMGGYGAWYLAHRAPERFAAVATMAGPAVPWWTYRIAEARIPVWVFHGARDEAVPVAESERMVAALRAAGGDVRFTSYPEGGHAIREPFDGDELYEWLLTQRRDHD